MQRQWIALDAPDCDGGRRFAMSCFAALLRDSCSYLLQNRSAAGMPPMEVETLFFVATYMSKNRGDFSSRMCKGVCSYSTLDL